METTERNAIYVRLSAHVGVYIDHACYNFSRSFKHINKDDLKQDCAEKLLAIIESMPGISKIPENQIIAIFKTSIYNVLRDIYRSHQRTILALSLTSEMFQVVDPTFDAFEQVLFKQYRSLIRASLKSELQRHTFDLLMDPDIELIREAIKDQQTAEVSKLEGSLVMGSAEVKLNAKHYAKRLNVSPATMSRALRSIREITASILIQDSL